MNLDKFIDKTKSTALNVDENFPLDNLFNPSFEREIRSDADDQLVIHIHFTERVKLTGFSIQAAPGPTKPELIKLFKNSPTLDFGDCETLPAEYQLDLGEEEVAQEILRSLSVATFTGVDFITVFIQKSIGGDVSAISSIKFYGDSLGSPQMGELKKVEESYANVS